MTDNASAGATPAAAGATPAQTTPVSPAAEPPVTPPIPPATGDPEPLGDAGKRALEAERLAAKAANKRAEEAEKALEALKLAGASDAEKAITQAKKDGAAEVTAKWSAQVRRSEVRVALSGAGINASVLDLAVNAPEFATLNVTDEGEVEGLAAAIEAFRKARADLFTKPVPQGSADGGSNGTVAITKEQVALWTKDPAQYEKHRDEILNWMATSKR